MPSSSPINASLFVTCIIDQLYPQVGVSVVRVLRRLGVGVDFPSGQTCCGQPLYNSGFVRESLELGRRVIEGLAESQYVVVPSGSCAAMLRVFYLDLFADDAVLLPQAKQLAAKTYEFSEFLTDVLGVEETGASYPAKATYHPSCHLLRELGAREGPERLLRNVDGLELTALPQAETCCGFGGTFSVKYPHISEGMVTDKIRNVVSTGADTLVACDMSCLMNIGGALSRQGADVQVKHLAQVLEGKGD